MAGSEGWLASREPGFGSFIRRIIDSEIPDKAGNVILQKHQLVVRKFLVGSPYRGLLVFHGLGSGKTCAAVSAVEALLVTRERVFVFLPASLQSNFEKEIDKCASDTGIDKGKVHFVRINGVRTTSNDTGGKGINVQKMTVDGLSVHGSVIVVDEVHNLAGYKKNGGKRGEALYHLIYNARDVKVVCLSGTVIVNSPFELGILLNMISGPQRTLRFRNPTSKSDDVRTLLDRNTGVASHYADGLTTVVQPVPEGYSRKAATSQLLLRSGVDTSIDPHEKLRQEIRAAIGASSSKLTEEALFPEIEQDFDDKFVDSESGKIVNEAGFLRSAVGLVSHFQLTSADAKKQGFPDVLPERRIVLNMSATMFERYNEQRAIEISMEKSNAKRAKRTGDDQNGNFRSGSRMVCNFAFAKRGTRPFQAVRRRENDDGDEEGQGDAGYQSKLLQALGTLTREALTGSRLREYSPKMAAIMSEIEKGRGPALVYSNFRTMEGAGIMARVLEAAGYSRLAMDGESVSDNTDHKKGVFHEFQGASENPAALDLFNGNNAAWNAKRGSKRNPVDVILITGAGAEGISLKGVRQVHIMEPHWHEIRIQQVIGRAARLGSHSHLPESDRTVSVYRYAMQFAPGKQRQDQQLRRFDRNLTTDQHIDNLSAKKAALAQTFLSPLRSVAVDCGLYPESMACFGDTDVKNKRKFRLVEKKGVTVMLDDSSGKAYSYADFKRDRKLVEIKL